MKLTTSNLNVSDADIRLLRVFKAVVENNGFVASEVALNKSKSAISLDISNLENRLGMRLCVRGRAGFAVTPEGQTVYRAALELFDDMARFSGKLASASGVLSGQVTLAVIDNIGSIAGDPMTHAIASFRGKHPGVELTIESGASNSVERVVLDKTADVGISFLSRSVPGLESSILFDETQFLFCGRRHPLFDAPDDQLTAATMKDYSMISVAMAEPTVSQFLNEFKPGPNVNSLDCVILVILAGVDLGFLPPHYARHWVARGELRAIRTDRYRTLNAFHLMSLKSACQRGPTRSLIQELTEAFQRLPVPEAASLL